eukprot:scaffold368522_cov21-Prasinocladus_malaysianus.AAC.1
MASYDTVHMTRAMPTTFRSCVDHVKEADFAAPSRLGKLCTIKVLVAFGGKLSADLLASDMYTPFYSFCRGGQSLLVKAPRMNQLRRSFGQNMSIAELADGLMCCQNYLQLACSLLYFKRKNNVDAKW